MYDRDRNTLWPARCRHCDYEEPSHFAPREPKVTALMLATNPVAYAAGRLGTAAYVMMASRVMPNRADLPTIGPIGQVQELSSA